MSIKANQYLIYGVKLPYPKVEEQQKFDADEFYDNAYEVPKPGIIVLQDGMMGKYMIIGTILIKSGVDELIDGPINMDRTNAEIDKEQIRKQIKDLFNIDEPCSLIFVTHYR